MDEDFIAYFEFCDKANFAFFHFVFKHSINNVFNDSDIAFVRYGRKTLFAPVKSALFHCLFSLFPLLNRPINRLYSA